MSRNPHVSLSDQPASQRPAPQSPVAPAAPVVPVSPAGSASATPSDDELMRAYAAGDPIAFERLYQRHHQALYRFIRRVLGGALSAQVDEVFQDTWLRIVQAPGAWQPQGAAFRTWLFTLAHNRAIDQLRKSGREVSLDTDNDSDSPPPFEPAGTAAWSGWPATVGADGQIDRVFWRAAGARLLACLDQLPGKQRSIFLLHHEDGIAVEELAASLGVGFETAKSRLRYAMSKLRVCMGAYLPGDSIGAAMSESAP